MRLAVCASAAGKSRRPSRRLAYLQTGFLHNGSSSQGSGWDTPRQALTWLQERFVRQLGRLSSSPCSPQQEVLLVPKTEATPSKSASADSFLSSLLATMASRANKNDSGLVATKNASYVRKAQLDWQLTVKLATLLKGLPKEEPLFVEDKAYKLDC